MSRKEKHWATCEYCSKPMSHGCRKHWYVIDGKPYAAIPMGDPRERMFDSVEVCHDCNARRGEYHHPGCDMERCPKCGSQMIGFHAKGCSAGRSYSVIMEPENQGGEQ